MSEQMKFPSTAPPTSIEDRAKGILESYSKKQMEEIMSTFPKVLPKAGRSVSDEAFTEAVAFLQKDDPSTDWTDSYEALRMAAFAEQFAQAEIDRFIPLVEKELLVSDLPKR